MFSAAKTSAPSTGAYTISRSVRLRSSASAYLNRTQASSLTSTYKWTYSAWIKRGTLGVIQYILNGPSGANGNYIAQCYFNSDDTIILYEPTSSFGGGNGGYFKTNQVFRDPSSWYHIVIAEDATSPFIKLYVNGVQVTSFSTYTAPTTNVATKFNVASSGQFIGAYYNGANNFDGYLAEVNFIDGQALTPSSFGSTNTTTGVWQPIKYSGTYGTNGFYLNFSNNASTTTLGYDTSGNGNNWTANNISLTAGVTYDSMIDTPTPYADGGNGRGNYPVISPLVTSSAGTISAGNLNISGTSTSGQRQGTMGASSGKWYWEVTTNWDTAQASFYAGVSKDTVLPSTYAGQSADSYAVGVGGQSTIFTYNNATQTSYTATPATPVVLQIALDLDNNKVWFGVNNTWVTGNPSAGTGQTYTIANAGTYLPAFRASGGTTSTTGSFNAGQRPFSYTPPTGFVALNTFNLPDPTIKNGASYMAATLYTGNGSTQSLTNTINGISFQPDLVWVKARSLAYSNYLYDSVRGTGTSKSLISDATAAEGAGSTNANLTSFDLSGFSLGTTSGTNGMNANAVTYVGWQWKAGGTSSSNTNGSITSTVSVNATAGFSVVTYTGTGSAATIGHGLGVAPSMMIVKTRSVVNGWLVYHSVVGNGKYLVLSNTNATTIDSTTWNNTSPTSSVFSVGTGVNTNQSGTTYIAYLWSEVAGFSKFGSYTGNGSTDGTFIYLGFRPRFVMIKDTTNGQPWMIVDSSRDTYNVAGDYLEPNSSQVENGGSTVSSSTAMDFLSNGIKMRNSASSSGYTNANGDVYIYAAFAENPFRNALAR